MFADDEIEHKSRAQRALTVAPGSAWLDVEWAFLHTAQALSLSFSLPLSLSLSLLLSLSLSLCYSHYHSLSLALTLFLTHIFSLLLSPPLSFSHTRRRMGLPSYRAGTISDQNSKPQP